MTLKTYAYVDGFNLYYRALKNTPHKWLDLDSFLRRVFPRNEFELIRYFTAKVKPLPHDPDQRIRQEVYLRALRTLECVQIHFGHFTSHPMKLPLVRGASGRVKFAEVMKSEEKGSDVNLATHLVNDAHKGAFETATTGATRHNSHNVDSGRTQPCEGCHGWYSSSSFFT